MRMEEGRIAIETALEYVARNRYSSGCMIVMKEGGDGSSKKADESVRPCLEMCFDSSGRKGQQKESNESGSSDEECIRAYRRLELDKGKYYHSVAEIVNSGDDIKDTNEEKRTRFKVYDFDEYDGNCLGASKRKRTDEIGSPPTRKTRADRINQMGGNLHSTKLLRDGGCYMEPIRVQGKTGFLKMRVNKTNFLATSSSLGLYDGTKLTIERKSSMTEDAVKEKPSILTSFLSELVNGTTAALSSKQKCTKGKLEGDGSDEFSRKIMQSKNCLVLDSQYEEIGTSLKKVPKKEFCLSADVSSRKALSFSLFENLPGNAKQGKVKSGNNTEKQNLRERLKKMLLDAGWTIDYRPRRNRDYHDAVYINRSGTAYWSIIKAYDAFRQELHDDKRNANSVADEFSFTLLPDEILDKLTRNTQKKIKRKRKQKKESYEIHEVHKEKVTQVKMSSLSMNDVESFDSDNKDGKIRSFVKRQNRMFKISSVSSPSVSSKRHCVNHQINDEENPTSVPGVLQKSKSRKLGRCLLARNSEKGPDSKSEVFVPHSGKRTILSWLIDCGTVKLKQKVVYMNRRRTKIMLEGYVTREGIRCGCCRKVLSVSMFEIHAGSKMRQPFQNICLDSGMSLVKCQVDAWKKLNSVKKIGFHLVDVDRGDPNDDICYLCGDGGSLICCDGCPSAFHQSCLDIKVLPPGDWRCPNCSCKFCGIASEEHVDGDLGTSSLFLTCRLCAKKFHKLCVLEEGERSINTDICAPSFCGSKCRELFGQLQNCIGVKHKLEGGYSLSLIHRIDDNSHANFHEHSLRFECNSKLAMVYMLMDECFLPMIDLRGGIDIIHNVVYNCGSNFSRLNFDGFHTAILEKGDELVSAASIRFHGTRLAEMPFIGTRHVYRRRGMCRKLVDAIESILVSWKVERLVVPAISDVESTWTEVFGFAPVDESLKEELKSAGVLAFPGVAMLAKQFCRRIAQTEDGGIPNIESPADNFGEIGGPVIGALPEASESSFPGMAADLHGALYRKES